jgi:hypothetical protein
MLTKLPLVFSTLLFSLSGSDGRAAAPGKPAVETRAQKDHGARSERTHERHDLCATLSCSAAQRSEIEGIIAKMREQLKALHGNHGAEGKALADAMRDGKLDRKEVIGALGKGDELRAKREAIFAEAIVAIYGKLDDAQRTRLQSMVEAHGVKALIGNRGAHRGFDKAGKGKPDKADAKAGRRAEKAERGDEAERGGEEADHGSKPAKSEHGKAAKSERKASKVARFGRVKGPVAKVDGFKSRS